MSDLIITLSSSVMLDVLTDVLATAMVGLLIVVIVVISCATRGASE